MPPDPSNCARDIIEVIPLVMRTIRAEIRRSRFHEMSLAQFRSLAFLGRNPGAMLSDVADHLGLTLPSASKLVDGLVVAGLLTRRGHGADRRRVMLGLTQAGQAQYRVAYDGALRLMTERVAGLDETERSRVSDAMSLLRDVFSRKPAGAVAEGLGKSEIQKKKSSRPLRQRPSKKKPVYANGPLS